MNNPPSVICTKHFMSGIVNGNHFNISSSHANFKQAQRAFMDKNWDLFSQLVKPVEAIKKFVSGKVEIVDETIFINGEEIDNYVADKIIEFMKEEIPFEYLIPFLERLMANPSYNSRQELYRFLEIQQLPITEDGHFLAYKALTSDWKDIHTRTIDNSIGRVVEMDRGKVDDNASAGCSKGLHAGSIDYVRNFGRADSKFVVVKIDPADVVSVPNEDSRKLRTCRYQVMEEYVDALPGAVYNTSSGNLEETYSRGCNNANDDHDDLDRYWDDDSYDEDEVTSTWYDNDDLDDTGY